MLGKSPKALAFITLMAIHLGIAVAAHAAESRTWSDASGQFTLTAKFVSLDGDQVVLDRENGEKMTIPLAKLSKADQDYVATQKESPFKSMGSSPFTPVAPRVETRPVAPPVVQHAAPRTVKVNWTRSRVILLQGTGSDWNATPPTPFEFSPRPNPTALPAKTDFFEGFTGVAINTVAKKAIVGYKLGKPGRGTKTTRVLMCDIQGGRTLETAVTEGEMVPLALHDNGQHFLMRSDEFGIGNHGRLEVWAIQGEQIVRSVTWKPYDDAWAGGKNVVWAEFVDGKTLATVSGAGKFALWDIGDIKPLCHFDMVDGALPALSADRKLLAFCAKDRVGLFDMVKRRVICVQATPRDLSAPRLAFSPSGKKIGCIANDRILVWDTATGELLQDFPTPGISIRGAIDFPHDEYILGAKQYLVALDTQIKMWHYKGAEYVRTVGGATFMAVSPHNAGGVLAATTVPHEQALTFYQKALTEPDIFVFRKGSTVKLNVSGVPGGQQGRVREAITKKLQAMDCKIAPSASVEVVASVEGPKQKTVRYMHSGEYKVQEYRTWLKFMYQGKPAWQSSGTNISHFISLKKGENIEGVLRKASQQPSYGFYDHIALPEFVQKPSSDNKNASGGQTVGASQVTTRGFQ